MFHPPSETTQKRTISNLGIKGFAILPTLFSTRHYLYSSSRPNVLSCNDTSCCVLFQISFKLPSEGRSRRTVPGAPFHTRWGKSALPQHTPVSRVQAQLASLDFRRALPRSIAAAGWEADDARGYTRHHDVLLLRPRRPRGPCYTVCTVLCIILDII